MMKWWRQGVFLLLCSGLLVGELSAATAEPTKVEIIITAGSMTFELHSAITPKTSAQFMALARAGYYEGKSFYRVVAGHVIQAGLNDDKHPDLQKYRLPAEFSNQLPQIRGSLGLARGDEPDSGSVEFYICLERRAHLDGQYTNFGQLIAGDAVLSAIANGPVTEQWLDNPGGKPIAFHQPQQQVIIKKIVVLPAQSL